MITTTSIMSTKLSDDDKDNNDCKSTTDDDEEKQQQTCNDGGVDLTTAGEGTNDITTRRNFNRNENVQEEDDTTKNYSSNEECYHEEKYTMSSERNSVNENKVDEEKNEEKNEENDIVDDDHDSHSRMKQNEAEEDRGDDFCDDNHSINNNNCNFTIKYNDHFTLNIPSSTIRYRTKNSCARIIETENTQLILEEKIICANTNADNNNNSNESNTNTMSATKKFDNNMSSSSTVEITIRRVGTSSTSIRFLRLSYVIVTAFYTGFLFILGLQYLLFVSLDLLVDVGLTGSTITSPSTSNKYENLNNDHMDASITRAILSFLSFPGLIYGFATLLVVCVAYILDMWDGHVLIRTFTFRAFSIVAVEWIYFLLFLATPILVMCITLMLRIVNWWEITLLYWFISATILFVIFAVNVCLYEMQACRIVMNNLINLDVQQPSSHATSSFVQFIKQCILFRQTYAYSGYKYIQYLASGVVDNSQKYYTNNHRNQIKETIKERISLYAKLTTLQQAYCNSGPFTLFEQRYDRIYSMEDALDIKLYITAYTWSLERMFCRQNESSKYITILKGPGALTRSQMNSSIICSVIGVVLLLLIAVSLTIFMQVGWIGIISILFVGLLVTSPISSSTYATYRALRLLKFVRTTNKKNTDRSELFTAASLTDDNVESETEGFYHVNETYRISKPAPWLCWILFVMESSLFYFLPLLGLLLRHAYTLAGIFFIVAGLAGMRYYINVAIILEEVGRLDLIDASGDDANNFNDRNRWRKESRLNEIVDNITRGRTLSTFMSILGVIWIALSVLAIGAIGTEITPSIDYPPSTFVYDFEYIQKDQIRYPNCQLSENVADRPLYTMADYAFLSGLAYRSDNETQRELDGWFNGSAIAHPNIVNEWRTNNDIKSPVTFKLITFPDHGNFSYVSIRGTANAWDLFADAQLWSAAALMQGLRFVLPAGSMWTPIMDNLIWFINLIEGDTLQKISFYHITTKFVNFIKSQPETYSGVKLTGHSLGGGLAIISGAQTDVDAVALSGPNALLSRASFRPPVTANALNEHTFNIIPANDIIPRIDLPAENYQNIRCLSTDILKCHDSLRSFCEISYSCGSRGRPVICTCVQLYGYPEPSPKEGTIRSFGEACGF